MKQSKDVFDIFRERQHLLEERPSAQSWRRLERRLDIHARHHHRSGLRRGFAMAAGVLALAVFVGLTGIHLGREQARIAAAKAQDSFFLEHLSANDIDPGTARMLEFNRQHPNARIQVSEGKPGQELIVKTQEGL